MSTRNWVHLLSRLESMGSRPNDTYAARQNITTIHHGLEENPWTTNFAQPARSYFVSICATKAEAGVTRRLGSKMNIIATKKATVLLMAEQQSQLYRAQWI